MGFAIDHGVERTRHTLPRAHGGVIALHEMLPMSRVGRDIGVAFQRHDVAGLCEWQHHFAIYTSGSL